MQDELQEAFAFGNRNVKIQRWKKFNLLEKV